MDAKIKWYERTWAVRLLLIFFYPVGLYGFIRGAIRGAKKPVVLMIITTIINGGFWAIIIFTPYTPPDERKTIITQSEEKIIDKSEEAIIDKSEEKTIDKLQPIIESVPLYQAVGNNDLKEVKRLLKKGKSVLTPSIPSINSADSSYKYDVDKDAYYLALKNGYFDIAEEISKFITFSPYWVNREGIISLNSRDAIIGFLITHNIYLPSNDVKTLINISEKGKNNVEKQNARIILNNITKIKVFPILDTYAKFGIDLYPYLESPDIWESVIFETLASFNQLAGKWKGHVYIYDQFPVNSSDSSNVITEIYVSLDAKFNKNIRKATDSYFEYDLYASFNKYYNVLFEAMSKKFPLSRSQIKKAKNKMWTETMKGVQMKLNTEHVKGEIKVGDYNVKSEIKLSAQAFEHDFLNKTYLNATKSKIKLTFSGSYISKFLPVYNFEIILEKK
jgi:hypothetical protein